MGNVEFGIPVLLKRLTEEFSNRQCQCFYFSIPNGKGIDGSKELFEALNIQAQRIDITNSNEHELVEHLNYSQDELEDMLRLIPIDKREATIKQVKDYLESIRRSDQEIGIDMLIVWGNRTRERTIYHYAKKHNIPIYIFEHGYFRPFTLTVDSVGINFENSVPRTREFYSNVKFDRQRFDRFLTCPEYAVKDEQVTKEFRMISEKYSNSKSETSERLHKQIKKVFREGKIRQAIRRQLSKLVNHIISFRYKQQLNALNTKTRHFLESGDRFLFVPFQLETDTQTVLFSPYIKTMEELVLLFSDAIDRYNRDYNDNLKVVFKTHPMYTIKEPAMELSRIIATCHANQNIFITNSVGTDDLITKSECVITINSTVGIEALVMNKKVVTLGNAFYNIEGIVNHVKQPSELNDVLYKTLTSEPDWNLVERFLYYIRFHYFSEIFYLNPDKASVKRLVDRILQMREGGRES